jgi:hypothetical protein
METFILVVLILWAVLGGFGQIVFWIISSSDDLNPVQLFGKWKRVQSGRMKTPRQNKSLYVQRCEAEKEAAKEFLIALGVFFAILLLPLSFVLGVLYLIYALIRGMFSFFGNIDSVVSAARNKFEEV